MFWAVIQIKACSISVQVQVIMRLAFGTCQEVPAGVPGTQWYVPLSGWPNCIIESVLIESLCGEAL